MYNKIVLLIVMLIDMKTTEETDFGFKSELQFHYNYSFFDNDLRIKQLENHDFIVPWQMVETEKKEVLVE